jgi:hypothetical protein
MGKVYEAAWTRDNIVYRARFSHVNGELKHDNEETRRQIGCEHEGEKANSTDS